MVGKDIFPRGYEVIAMYLVRSCTTIVLKNWLTCGIFVMWTLVWATLLMKGLGKDAYISLDNI